MPFKIPSHNSASPFRIQTYICFLDMFLKYFGLKRICLVIGIMANLASICDSISDESSDISDFGGFTVTGSFCKQHIVLNHVFFRYKSPGG